MPNKLSGCRASQFLPFASQSGNAGELQAGYKRKATYAHSITSDENVYGTGERTWPKRKSKES
jgi:hypothetical protein